MRKLTECDEGFGFLAPFLNDFKRALDEEMKCDTGTDFLWINYSGSSGWHRAFVEACIDNEEADLLKFYENLEWFESDRFDSFLIDVAVFVGVIKHDKMMFNETKDEKNSSEIKMLNGLVGASLVELNERRFIVNKDDMLICFTFEEDEGSCYGFNEITTNLFISKEELHRNPIITSIQTERDVGNDEDRLIITFFGEQKQLAEIESMSSSGSGWSYGATVTLHCLKTNEKEVLTSW